VPEMQLVAEATWKKLPKEYQDIIRDCARESAIYERELWEKRIHEAEMEVKKAGCEVIELTPEEKARFQEAMLPIYGEYCSDYMDIIEKILEEGK